MMTTNLQTPSQRAEAWLGIERMHSFHLIAHIHSNDNNQLLTSPTKQTYIHVRKGRRECIDGGEEGRELVVTHGHTKRQIMEEGDRCWSWEGTQY